MKRKTAGRVAKPKYCAHCGGPISELRPVFMVGHASGRITGPYHAGCAEKLVLAGRSHTAKVEEVLGNDVGIWPSRREETLPW